MRDNRKARRAAVGIAILILLAVGPFSYSQGKLTTELEWQGKYFAANIDLIKIVDKVLKDNTVLKETVKELLNSIEIKDRVIEEQRGVISDQDKMISDLENRPPEIVEVEIEVPFEVIVEVPVEVRVEVPVFIEVPATPDEPDYIEERESSGGGSGDNDNDITIYTEPEPEPEPDPEPDNGDWDDRHDGRHDHKDHHDKHGGKRGRGRK